MTPTIGLPQDIEKTSTTHTALAGNTVINITDQTNQSQDTDKISRDTDNASFTMTEINTEVLEIRSDISKEVAVKGFDAVGTYAMEQELAGDETWADGGISKTLAHAAMGATVAAIGNGDALGGALGAGAREAVSGATQNEDEATQQVVSSLVGAVAGGGTGAAVALDGEKYNRQLHQREIAWIDKNAEAFAMSLNGGKEPTSQELYDAKARLAQQGMRGVDKAWSMTLGSQTDDDAKNFLNQNNANLFVVKDEQEFRDGSITRYGDTTTEISNLNNSDYNNLRNFYNETNHATSTNTEGRRNLAQVDLAESNQAIDDTVNAISNINADSINQTLRTIIPDTIQSIGELPTTVENAGNYLDAVLPTTNSDRMDELYGQGNAGSHVQANLNTGAVISTVGMSTGVGAVGSSVVRGVGNAVDGAVDGIDMPDVSRVTGQGEVGDILDANGNKVFTNRAEYQAPNNGTGNNYTVYQRDIDLDAEFYNPKTRTTTTNRELMSNGNAPFIEHNGEMEQVQLHHSRQDARGPLFEVTQSTHNARTNEGKEALHPYTTNRGRELNGQGSGERNSLHPDYPVDRPNFDRDRNAYWIDRLNNIGGN